MVKKVSIITPCYNGEDYIERFISSILSQTYKNIELIIINDGSTDKTEKKFFSFKQELEKKGIEFKYIYQENSGQAAAMNKGLKIFTGDYLTWMDSDDILPRHSIEMKVEFLEKNKKYGIVRTDGYIVHENDISTVIGYFAKNNPNKYKENLFIDYILENKVWIANGCFMTRREVILDVIPNREIYPSRAGQNWQLLLPIMYKYRCGYLDEPLFVYVVRENSHSHSVKKLEDKLKRCDDHEDILINTIDSINMEYSKKIAYKSIIKEKYIRKRFLISLRLKDKSLVRKEYKNLSNYKFLKSKDKLYYFLFNLGIYNFVLKLNFVIKKSLRVLKKSIQNKV